MLKQCRHQRGKLKSREMVMVRKQSFLCTASLWTEVMDKVHVSEAILTGQSWGAMIALQTAISRSQCQRQSFRAGISRPQKAQAKRENWSSTLLGRARSVFERMSHEEFSSVGYHCYLPVSDSKNGKSGCSRGRRVVN